MDRSPNRRRRSGAWLAAAACAVGALAACASSDGAGTTGPTTAVTTATKSTTATPVAPDVTTVDSAPPATDAPAGPSTTIVDLPPVDGPEPSYTTVAFYYPWYRSEPVNSIWEPWHHGGEYSPPSEIASDFYPLLGPYSSTDEVVVAQHFAWLRRAGVGVVATSWWGQGDYTDRAVPLLLEMGERYGIRVAFHIEPNQFRNAERLVEDVRYLSEQYGSSPAFFRTSAPTRWSGDGDKGLFFLWVAEHANLVADPPELVAPDYWRDAMDAIHALPDSALVIANTRIGARVDLNHFDGLYNYASPDLAADGGFKWAQGIPPDAWYVPSVLPGFHAERIGQDPAGSIDRRDGDAYDAQWEAALGVGVRPDLVTITSFNEWLEGTQIEPAIADPGSPYLDYGEVPPDGYLDRTRQWIDRAAAATWDDGVRIQVQLETTSDWTLVRTVGGGDWRRPTLLSSSPSATIAGFEFDMLRLSQDVADAERGASVDLAVDLEFVGLDPAATMTFDIGRGSIGATTFSVWRYDGDEPVLVDRFTWDGVVADPENRVTVTMPVAALLGTG
jgi:hypothetical protein